MLSSRLPASLWTAFLSVSVRRNNRGAMLTCRWQGLLTTQLFSSSVWHMYGESGACKAHDFVLLSGPFMMYALQNRLSTGPREALCMLIEAISRLWAMSFMQSELPKLKASIQFPGAQHNIVQHRVHHIADGIKLHVPPWASAMWPFQRMCWSLRITAPGGLPSA